MRHYQALLNIKETLQNLLVQIESFTDDRQETAFHAWVDQCVFDHVGFAGLNVDEQQIADDIVKHTVNHGFTPGLLDDLQGRGIKQAQQLLDAVRSQLGVCAYCHVVYHMLSNETIYKLTDDVYAEVESNNADPLFSCGVCDSCRIEILNA